MKKILLSIITILIILTSCSTIKTVKLMKSGEVEQEVFNVQIPFEYRLGMIILKVNISGKDYDFLLDTGAPNAISKNLAKELNLDATHEEEVGDSQGEEASLGIVNLERVNINGVDFLNTSALIADLDLSKEVRCMKIDGLLGSNLMRNAVWKFDYQNQVITISKSIESFNIPDTAYKVSFSTDIAGVPSVNVAINDVVEKWVTVDLGSNGDISLSKKTFKALIKKNPSISHVASFGNSSSGLYGMGKRDTSYYVKSPNVSFGEISLDNTVVSFSQESGATIGTKLFKNYDLIISWFTKEIFFIKKKNYNRSTLSTLGLSLANMDNKLVVNGMFEKSDAHKKGVQIGDQIIKFGETRYDQLLPEQWCELIEKWPWDNFDKVNIIVLRENKEISFTLKKENLL
jgi:predicted aspartyl protease